MKQVDTFAYEVVPGEKVTLVAKLTGLPSDAVTVSKPFETVAGAADPTWDFVVPTQNATNYTAFAEVSFVQPAQGAQAVISVQSSIAGTLSGPFQIPPIDEASADKDPGFTFWLK